MIYNLINGAAVLFGGLLGMLIGKFLPKKISDTLMRAVALGVMYIGISTMLTDANSLIVLLCLAFGAVIGELLRIEDSVNKLGEYIENRVRNNEQEKLKTARIEKEKTEASSEVLSDVPLVNNSIKSTPKAKPDIATGFVSSVILFCSGSMAIVGSIQAGLLNDGTTLLAKSVLDGVIGMIYATTMGFGVLLSAIPLIIYQGLFVLLASSISSLLNNEAITILSSVGGIIILGIGINLMFDTKIRIGSFIPAIFIPIILSALKIV
ncbi:MAG TPA: DUF554 domain-containing protein [Clostridiaceae bacterium]|nr:DUF554 domain-containing protein [Clostridiaceae bacterium]